MTKHLLLLTCALGAFSGVTGVAAAQTTPGTAAPVAASPSATEVGAVIVTAEKRSQNLQKVPVAVTAFTTKQRDLVGIENLQDMTNFTPGLVYSSVLDRVTLRGVGRQTNLLSADAAVTTYVDGFFTTSAVEASKPPMFVSNIEVLRGPQGTLQGRNAIGGALLVTTARPTSTPHAEGRLTIGNYGYEDVEAYVSGPIADGLNFRLQGYDTNQSQGYFKSLNGGPSEGNVLDQWYIEPSFSAKLGDNADLYVKAFAANWNNRGGPGARADYTTGPADEQLNGGGLDYNFNPGAAFNPLQSVAGATVAANPNITNNPSLINIRDIANNIPLTVKLRNSFDFDTEFTYHFPGFDVKYTGGFQSYKYDLNFGAVGGGTTSVPGDVNSFETCYEAYTGTNACGPAGPLTVIPDINYHYQENNQWFSHEITFASTGNGAFQWIGGLYYYDEHYSNPIVTTNPGQSQMSDPIYPYQNLVPGAAQAAPNPNNWISYDNYVMETRSEAVYGQIDWKITDTLKLTAGARYTQDHKDGTEYNRVVLFGGSIVQGLPAGFAVPGVPAYFISPYGMYVDPAQFGNGAKALDLTPNTVYGAPGACAPLTGGKYKGVTAPCSTSAATGITSRGLGDDFSDPTGTAGLEWTPTSDILAYIRYSRGYKSGGFNAGTISSNPEVGSEHVNAYEVGYKQTFGRNLVVDADLYYYDFQDAQYVVTTFVPNLGNEALLTNIPKSRVDGFELESIWTPIQHLQFDLSYSFNDTSILTGCTPSTGVGCYADTADPQGLSPGARVVVPYNAATGASALQTVKGNELPNAPRNKVALNGNYTFVFDHGSLTLSATGIWRDQQYGAIFKEPYDVAPSWSQVDLRAMWKAPDDKYEIILYGRNVFNTVGYEAAAAGGLAQTNSPALALGIAPSYRTNNLYGINPPATYGIELHYKFF